MSDFVVRRAKIKGYEPLQDIVISEGYIKQIVPSTQSPSPELRQFDVEGRWVYPSFVNAHIHVDKALMTWAATEKSIYIDGHSVIVT